MYLFYNTRVLLWLVTLCLKTTRQLNCPQHPTQKSADQQQKQCTVCECPHLHMCGHYSPSVTDSNLHLACYNSLFIRNSVNIFPLALICDPPVPGILGFNSRSTRENAEPCQQTCFLFRCQTLSVNTQWKFVNIRTHRAMSTAVGAYLI